MKTRRITRTRYNCDFCKRGYWTRSAAEKHERGCTANPNRVCGLCASAIPALNQRPIAELIRCIDPKADDLGLSELRKLSENCPACILAAIRQSGIQQGDGEGFPPSVDFNFKDEYEKFWAEVNSIRQQQAEEIPW